MSADLTAHLIALHQRMGSAGRHRAVPRAHPPTLIEADYAKALIGMVKQWRASVQPLFDQLPDLIAEARRYRTDSLGFRQGHGAQGDPATQVGSSWHETVPSESFHLDDTSDGRRAKALLDRGRKTVAQQATQAPYIAQRYADQAVKQQGREFARQTKAALGVELPTLDRGVPTRIGHFANENALKIQSLGDDTFAKVGKLVAEGFTNDRSVDDIAADLEQRFGVAETYARNLARDQITKLTAQVARMRQQEVGIATFRWKTKGDGHVRPSHAVKNDRVFPYTGASAPSFFPGDEPGCRCQQIPIFDEIRMKAAALGRDPGAVRRR